MVAGVRVLPGAVFDSGTGAFSGTAGVKSGVGSSMVKVGLIFSTGVRRGVSKLVSGVWGGSLWTDWTSRLRIEPGGSGCGSGCGSGGSSSWTTGLGSDDFLCLDRNKELLLWPRRWPRARGDESADELEEVVVVVVVVVVAVEDRRKSGLKRALKSSIMLCFCETFPMAGRQRRKRRRSRVQMSSEHLTVVPSGLHHSTSAASWCSCTWQNSRTPSGDFPAGWQKERVHN